MAHRTLDRIVPSHHADYRATMQRGFYLIRELEKAKVQILIEDNEDCYDVDDYGAPYYCPTPELEAAQDRASALADLAARGQAYAIVTAQGRSNEITLRIRNAKRRQDEGYRFAPTSPDAIEYYPL